jgi:hypothetical protein
MCSTQPGMKLMLNLVPDVQNDATDHSIAKVTMKYVTGRKLYERMYRQIRRELLPFCRICRSQSWVAEMFLIHKYSKSDH